MNEAMHICSCCKVAKPFDAFYARANRPIGRDSWCKACKVARQRQNPNRLLSAKKWRLANAEKHHAAVANWKAVHGEELRQKRRAREAANRDHQRALERGWYRNNPARYAKKRIDRRQSVRKATPAWSNGFFVEEAYRLARQRTETTGIKWHVDHIVPLKNALVCGLHAHTNIQVIPAAVNHRKSNHLIAA